MVARLGPGSGLSHRHGKARRGVLEAGIEIGEMGLAGDYPGFHREHGLDEAGDAGGRLRMADRGLGGADQHRVALAARHDLGEIVDLDRIAERRSGPVGFHIGEIAGADPRIAKGRADHRLLSRAARSRQPVAASVLIDGRARDHGTDRVAVAHRVLQTLEDDDADALGAHIAIGTRVECAAPTGRRQHAGLGKGDGDVGIEKNVDAADKGETAFAEAQGAHGLMNGDERGGAGGIDRKARPVEIENIGQPVGCDRKGVPGAGPGLAGCVGAGLSKAVIGAGNADEDAGVAPRQGRREDAGIFQTMPGGFEEKPLLGVHEFGLAAGNAEKGRVEGLDLIEKTAVARAHPPRFRRLARRDQRVRVPAPVAQGGNAVDAVQEVGKEGRGVRRARQAAGQSDDRDQLAHGRAGFQRLDALAGTGEKLEEIAVGRLRHRWLPLVMSRPRTGIVMRRATREGRPPPVPDRAVRPCPPQSRPAGRIRLFARTCGREGARSSDDRKGRSARRVFRCSTR